MRRLFWLLALFLFTGLTVSIACGVLKPSMDSHDAKRTTFPNGFLGKVTKVCVDVDPEKNSSQVMDDLASLEVAS